MNIEALKCEIWNRLDAVTDWSSTDVVAWRSVLENKNDDRMENADFHILTVEMDGLVYDFSPALLCALFSPFSNNFEICCTRFAKREMSFAQQKNRCANHQWDIIFPIRNHLAKCAHSNDEVATYLSLVIKLCPRIHRARCAIIVSDCIRARDGFLTVLAHHIGPDETFQISVVNCPLDSVEPTAIEKLRATHPKIYHYCMRTAFRAELESYIHTNAEMYGKWADHQLSASFQHFAARRGSRVVACRSSDQCGVFFVSASRCITNTMNNKWCTVSFGRSSFNRDSEEYTTVIRPQERETYSEGAVFVVANTVLSHPYFEKYYKNGRVSRLRFGLFTSDGVLIPVREFCEIYPNLNISHHGQSLDTSVMSRRYRRSRRSTNRSRHVRFMGPTAFRSIAPAYKLMNIQERRSFSTLATSGLYLDYEVVFLWLRHILTDPTVTNEDLILSKNLWKNTHNNLLSAGFIRIFVATEWRGRPPLQVVLSLFDTRHLKGAAKLVSESNIRVVPIQLHTAPTNPFELAIMKQNLVHMVYGANVDPTWKRVAWQSLVNLGPYADMNDNPTDHHRLVMPKVNIKLGFNHILEGATRFRFSRTTHTLLDTPADGEFYSHSNVMFIVDGEEGYGPSVQDEIMTDMWNHAVKNKYFIQDDNGFLHLRPQLFELIPSIETRLKYLFHLGFVTWVNLGQGAHLPYRLSPQLFAYMLKGQSMITLEDLPITFSEMWFANWDNFSRYTNAELESYFGCTDEDFCVNRQDLFARLFMPDPSDLMAFAARFGTMPCLKGDRFAMAANDMFVMPSSMEVTYENFSACVNTEGSNHAVLFLKYAKTLNREKLVQLVNFVTGKNRLPIHNLGELQICVRWTADNGLPVSHNCMNTINFPRTTPETVKAITTLMTCVLSYDTVFGFA